MSFPIEESTIAGIHTAMRDGETNAAALVTNCLARIEAYDRSGPGLNAIVTVNSEACDHAARLDADFARTGEFHGPLHGIPVVVKDQIETAGIATAFGSIAMDGYVPDHDATVIRRLRAAGAIVLAKTTMPDFATAWFAYSSKSGTTRNPFHLDRDPGGSSSGTGAAVAANLAVIGVGEDTGGSIRLPASFNSLVGLKVTPGLISRHGISPLVAFQDSAGPMCRTVEDTARLLQVLVGYDPADPWTATAVIAGGAHYVAALDRGALAGRTLGVLRQAFGDAADPEAAPVNEAMSAALTAMRAAGANVVDVRIPDLDHYIELTSLYLTHSRHDIDAFLAKRPVPWQRVRDIHAAGLYHRALELFEMVVDGPDEPEAEPDYWQRYTTRETFQRLLINAMAQAGASALIFPTTRIPAPSRSELDAGRWTTFTFPANTLIAAQSWMPAVSVPAGFTEAGLPVGMEMVGLPYREADLLALAYAFEQATMHRRAPACAPALNTCS
ncbi:MAG: amidase family protein [Gammaproteobacteria bacterium]